jgi:hypothetical protein
MKMQNQPYQLKRYCNLFIILVSLLFLSHASQGEGIGRPDNSCQFSIEACTYNTFTNVNTQDKKSSDEYNVLLFRKGIEGKGIQFSFNAKIHSLHIDTCLTDGNFANSGWVKHILSFSKSHLLPRAFIHSFSFRGPPVLC